MLIVQKYGGTSVANAERINHVAERIADSYLAGNQMVVVLSAQGSLTDRLLQKAHEINPQASKRELDMLLTTGEQQSVALMAMALNRLGMPAVSLNAVQIGLEATDHYGNARIKCIRTGRILAELDKGNIVLVAGFQGVNSHGDLTTLGRGASNTTAVAIAAVLNADLCENCTDVDGVYTADPRVVRDAKKLASITYDEILEMSCQVFHNRAAEIAKRYNVKLIIRSSMTEESGTEVVAQKESSNMEDLYVSGVSVDRDVAQISLWGMRGRKAAAFNIFALLAKEDISVDIILQTPGANNITDISFTVSKQDSDTALAVLESNKESLGYEKLTHNLSLAKVSIVGAGMTASPGVAAAMFEALYENDIDIVMISTSEIKVAVLIDESKAEKAMQVVHEKFASFLRV
ncbi:MAG: aspartate kinase [Defluviitaleaceae bacterium]|nr:aspartate kinase [Defluviitaleaceae bacterium]